MLIQIESPQGLFICEWLQDQVLTSQWYIEENNWVRTYIKGSRAIHILTDSEDLDMLVKVAEDSGCFLIFFFSGLDVRYYLNCTITFSAWYCEPLILCGRYFIVKLPDKNLTLRQAAMCEELLALLDHLMYIAILQVFPAQKACLTRQVRVRCSITSY